MASLGQKTCDKLEKYCQYHFNPVTMGFSAKMQVRIMIAERMFHAYESGRVPPTQPPNQLVKVVADMVYRSILTMAATDAHMAELRDAVHITEDADGQIVRRTYGELANDIEAYDIFRRMWGSSSSIHHDKMVYRYGVNELINMGVQNRDPRALTSGLDRLEKIDNGFQEDARDFANTADTDRIFVSDARLVREDAEVYTPDEIEALKKKYGAYSDNIEELIQQDNGTYAPDPGEEDPDEGQDFFERMEKQMLGED